MFLSGYSVSTDALRINLYFNRYWIGDSPVIFLKQRRVSLSLIFTISAILERVAIFDDRLEVTSPGMLLNNVSIKKMIEGYSKPRNPAIANAFAYMKIIEKWGTGIPRIFRECRDYGLPDPELIDFDGDFRVNMYRNNTNKASNESINESISESLNSDEAVIMAIIKSNPQISQKEMATKSGFSRSKIQRILKVLQGKKVLYREVQEKMVTGKFYKFASQKRINKPSRMRYINCRQENILCFR